MSLTVEQRQERAWQLMLGELKSIETKSREVIAHKQKAEQLAQELKAMFQGASL